MSAEELDKLFKSKLNNKPVAPSPETWERLQARMQAAAPQEEKKPVMWYYSAAAAVTLLLGVGFWTMQDKNVGLPSEGTVATVQVPETGNGVTNNTAEVENGNSEKNIQTQATDLQPLASSRKEGLVAQTEPTAKRNTIVYPSAKTEKRNGTSSLRPEDKKPEMTLNPEMMAVAQPAQKTQEAASQEEPLEIIIKLDNQRGEVIAQATPEPVDEPAEEKGNGRVLKSILKQVKNLKDGEKVSLSELGITNRAYALETRIGNKTITKTIQL